MRAFLAELRAMVDRVRLFAILSLVAGAVVLASLLGGDGGISIGDGGWVILVGITLSSAYQVFESRRQAGRPDAGTWGLATAAGIVLAFAAFGMVALLLGPVVAATPVLADNPVPLAIVAWVLLGAGAVAWQRGSQRRAIAIALALSMGMILGGVAALRGDAGWGPVAVLAILLGLGLFVAAGGAGWQQWWQGRIAAVAPAAPAASAAQRRTADPKGSKRARRDRGRRR